MCLLFENELLEQLAVHGYSCILVPQRSHQKQPCHLTRSAVAASPPWYSAAELHGHRGEVNCLAFQGGTGQLVSPSRTSSNSSREQRRQPSKTPTLGYCICTSPHEVRGLESFTRTWDFSNLIHNYIALTQLHIQLKSIAIILSTSHGNTFWN